MKPLRELGRFLMTMDAKAATSLFVTTVLLAFVLLLISFGPLWLHLDNEGINRVVLAASESPWAVPILVFVFVVLALTGFPQILLITATVVAFPGRDGIFYSWLATMISATFTFGLGRWLGGRFVGRIGGERAQPTIDFIGRHGILASGLIRIVPSAPFVIVNAAAGAAHIPLWKYWAGTSVGIIPKILFVAILYSLAPDRRTLEHGVEGLAGFFASWAAADWVLVGAVIGGWLGLLLLFRSIYETMRLRDAERLRD